jgi:hypothetical protein
MFIRSVSALALASASILVTPQMATAAPAAAAAPATPGVCSKLAADYDQIDKALALTYAEGVGDNSAPRETNRQIESANYLARGSMTLTLMQAHHCAMPDHASSDSRYISAALNCATDMLKSSADAPSCKMDTWQPSK